MMCGTYIAKLCRCITDSNLSHHHGSYWEYLLVYATSVGALPPLLLNAVKCFFFQAKRAIRILNLLDLSTFR